MDVAVVEVTRRGHVPCTVVARERRSSPVGIVDTIAAVEADTARRCHIPHIVAVVVRVRDRRSSPVGKGDIEIVVVVDVTRRENRPRAVDVAVFRVRRS